MQCPKCQSDNPDATDFCGKCGAPLAADLRMAASLTKTLAAPLPLITKDKLIARKYRVLEEIGRGGMGIVYKAEDLQLQRCVALKFLPPHLMDSPELRERFLIEARAAAALSHPNICIIHEVGESDDRRFIAMEYVEGETLRDRIRTGPLRPDEALGIIGQVAAGLSEAHRKGIIHRDIKSANIMVTERGQAKVMDFGLAKLRGGSSLTKTQTTLGTVAYMSPEQARGDDLDQRTDIWSLGVVLYEMLTGELPFKGDHDQTVIHAILNREAQPPSEVKSGVPAGIDAVVLRTLDKTRESRYQTMDDLRDDLGAVAEGLKPLKAGRRRGRAVARWKSVGLLPVGLAAVLILFGLNAGGFRDKVFGGRGRAAAAIRLAVLPFANLSDDPESGYLSDGITQEMITQIGRLRPDALSVIARTSVMRYKRSETPIDRIGQELGVDFILAGSARREGPRLNVAAELIRVTDQVQIWAETFERDLSDILMVQGHVAQAVAKALAVRLLPAEQARLDSARTVDPEAYDALLKGQALWPKMTPDALDQALRWYEAAIEKDPSYAPAYAGVAWTWQCRRQMRLVPYSEAFRIKDYALRALALDGSCPEAHEILAAFLTWSEWDFAAAAPEWKKALELNPNNANTHAFYAHYLAIRGRAADGLRHSQLAIKLDPFNALYHALYATTLQYLRRYDDMLAAARDALAIDPGHGVARGQFQFYYIAKGMREQQLADQRMRIAHDPERVSAFERGLAEGGYEGAQRAIADVLAARYERSEFPDALGVALRYHDAGDKDRAIEWLYRAYADHDQNMPYLGLSEWDALRGDPRFQALKRSIGLPVDE